MISIMPPNLMADGIPTTALRKPNFFSVPLVRQATEYSCGAAALLSVLYYWQVYDGGEVSLFKDLKTTEDGTDPLEMAKFAKKVGLNTQLKESTTLADIEEGLAKGQTILVDFQAWPDEPVNDYKTHWDSGHYAVVVGMDANRIYFMDPSVASGYGFLSREDFVERWHDFEIRKGKRVETLELAIFISGTNPLNSYPTALTAID